MRKKLAMLMASLFLVLGTAWADAPIPGQRYRLRNVMTGLYMQANGSSNLQLQEQKYSVLQFFSVEDAGDGKFYLKSESGKNLYVNASGWDAVVGSDDSKTPYTIDLVNGETDVYTLDQTVAEFIGKIGANDNTAGTSLYCNKGEENYGKWQFEAVANPQVCTFDPAKTYRIKSEYSGLYMQVTNYNTSGGTEGAFQLKDKSIVAEGQKFMFEVAGDGKYYLKTVKEGTTYYVNQGSWNFHAGAEATTPFTIAVVDGHTAVYSLHQTADKWNSDMYGYAGNSTTSATDGTKIYCNSPLAGNTIWSFEEVVADPNNITEQTQLTNGSYYKISGERGFIFGADDVVKGTNAVSQAYSEGNMDQHFAIISKNNKLYLYNVGAKKFVVKSGNNTKLVDLPEQPITLEKTSDNNYVWSIKLNGTNKINLSKGYNDYGIYTDYNTEDPGNRWLIYKVGTFDPTEALAAFDKVYVTVNYVLESGETTTIKKTATVGETFSISNTSTYVTMSSCTVDGSELTENNGVYSFTVNAAATVTVNLVGELPFACSESYENAVWYNLRIRPVRNGNEEFNWVSKTDATPYTFSSERPTTDAGLWAFVGNPIDGFKIYNKAAGSTMTLGVDGSNIVLQSGVKKTWTVGKCIEGGTNLRGFYLYEGTDNKYAHEMGGNFQIWNSTSAPTDGGSAFVVERPISTSRPYYSLKSATGTYLGLTPKAEGLVADGVYTITGGPVSGNGYERGYMVAGEGYAEYPVLTEIKHASSTSNSITPITDGKNWYVYTTAVGTYIYNIGLGKFLAKEWGNINFSDVPFAWTIKQNGNYTSIYDETNVILSMGCGRTAANRPIQWEKNLTNGGSTDGGAQHTFHAVVDGATTYATQIAAAQAAIAKVSVSFQENPLHLYYTLTANGAVFEYKAEAGKYIGFDADGWNVIDAPSAWTIQTANLEGYSHIVRADDATKHLGSSENTNIGTGIYSNVGSTCNKWALEGVYENYATTTTVSNDKRYFSSENLRYAGACNVLRFTLTNSSAYYEQANTNKRLSFDSFVLYNANGEVVKLTAENFTGNNTGKDFSKMLDGVNGQCCAGTWGQAGAQDDWFEIQLGNIDLGGMFSFSFVTENTNMDAKAFDISMRYESCNYILNIDAPYGYTITATYAGEAIAHGDIITGEFDESLLEIVAIDGYAHQVTVDKENRLVTVTFVQVEAIVNPAAVVALVNRIGGLGTAESFKFVHDPALDVDGETFKIGAEDGKILIKGSTLSALTTGLGWYLNNIAHINIAWNSLNEKTTTVRWDENAGYADLSHLPIPTTEEKHTSDAKYRYYLNYCTFGYSMTSWTWTRWQQEIDWMALHGINMPLQIIGLEEVWRKFLTLEEDGKRKYNYTDEEAKAFVAGPAFTAWWGMNNLEGWGGTGKGSLNGGTWDGAGGVQDNAWYVRQAELAKKIGDRQRELGMQPVLPGFSGMVPTTFTTKTQVPTDENGGKWVSGFQRPRIINPTYEGFADIAKDYYDCLEEVMGESQYYSMDPFHEGGKLSAAGDEETQAAKDIYSKAYKAVYDAMENAKSGSQWVIQQWQWYWYQKVSVKAVPEGKLIVLDLFSDGSPAFDTYSGYAPQDAVFCAIPNFGGRSGLMGRLQNVTDNYFKFKGQYENIKGIGTAPEAIEQTPVTYDLIYQLPWMNGEKPDVAAWVDNYAVARYGKDNAVVKEAWSLLRQGPLNYGADGIQGPVEDVWAARPNLDANPASAWGKTLSNAGGTYTPARRQMLIDAVYKLIDQEDELELTNGSVYKSNYLYDLVEFGGAVMADYAYDLLLGIKAAKNAAGENFANDETYKARRDAFLALIEDVDAFKGTNLNFRLGKWTQEARDAATEVKNATTATPDWYEFNNARTIITTWSSPNQNLHDYSYRSWQGLMKDLYLPRWQAYFDSNCNGNLQYGYFEWNWAHGKQHAVGQTAVSDVALQEGEAGYSYTRDPENTNTVEKAVEMLGKYIIPVEMADGTHYAYRYLTNDLSSKVTIIAAGESIDLTQYFGNLQGATVTGDFINGGTSTNFAEIPLKAGLADGAYTGTITLADGTVLTFGVSANPKYYGAYQIKYSGDPVFIQYNVGGDNSGSVGYKVMGATGYGESGNAVSTGLTADYEADKIFTIAPSGLGYTLSAQGQYLKTTASSGWAHIMFSDQKGDAGTYVFTDATNSLVTLKSTANTDKASVAIFGNGAWGNDVDGKAREFAIEKVENYAITIPEGGLYTVCLPFNVVLPVGVTAYDITVSSLTCGDDGAITTLNTIAVSNDESKQILKAGTPAVLKAAPGDYTFTITMDNNEAKTSSVGSKLRGNFVKQTLQPGTNGISKFVLEGGAFARLDAAKEIPANTCWIEAKIDAEHVEVTEHEGKIVKVDGWYFNYTESENGSITLTDVVEIKGDGDLEIKPYYTINGKTQRVSAISPTFLHGRTELTSITLPATLTNLGFREVVPMFTGEYEGKAGNGTEVTDENGKTTTQGRDECFVFPVNEETGERYKVSGDFAWKLTLDVTIDSETADFNDFGSSIVSTLSNSLADYYTKNMQIYMHKGHKNIVVKIDNNDDRYLYNTKVLDGEGNETAEDLVMTHFKFELEHDGMGGYQVVIYYENGKAKMYNISSSQQGTLVEFDRLYYSLPEGVHVKVTFEQLISEGLFVGCTNLKKIIVDPANPTFMGCDHGVLYDKNQYYVMRIPEGGGELGKDGRYHFSIPSKVVKLYTGAIHGVDADIVLHSNPQIGVVEGHPVSAKFYLSLDDMDPDETVGGARDFISTNNNTYVSANYKRAPLEEGKYGTIVLPFKATNWKEKYDFFEMTAADATSFHFSPVDDELKPNTAYLYKLKDGADNIVMGDEEGLDVFEGGEFTVQTHAKYNPDDETPGDFRALGAYVNHYIDTEAANKKNGSFYYYYSISKAQFLKVTKKLTYRPYRALFVVTPEEGQAAQAPARFGLRILKRDGTTTEIDPSQIEGWEEDVYYDLQGRRVENPTQGIYIVNGKKVIVK